MLPKDGKAKLLKDGNVHVMVTLRTAEGGYHKGSSCEGFT